MKTEKKPSLSNIAVVSSLWIILKKQEVDNYVHVQLNENN